MRVYKGKGDRVVFYKTKWNLRNMNSRLQQESINFAAAVITVGLAAGGELPSLYSHKCVTSALGQVLRPRTGQGQKDTFL